MEYSITLEPTLDLTLIFDCDTSDTPLRILYIDQTRDMSPIVVANCTYATPGQYHPVVSAVNRINPMNQSIRIDVEEPLSPFKVEVEDRVDINQLTSVTIHALEQIPFEGVFTLTIIDSTNIDEKNQTRTERVQLFASNDFTEQFYLNISSYGRQTLHVRGGDAPNIREAQATFTIGTDIVTKPQVYVLNQMGLATEDFIWTDIQWVNGVGFDVRIDYGHETKLLIRYGQIITSAFNRTVQKADGIHEFQWRKIAKQRLQVGYKYVSPAFFFFFSIFVLCRFMKAGTYRIEVTFIQPSSKFLTVEVQCPIVTIVQGITHAEQTCFPEQPFYLNSSHAINNVSASLPVLLLPYNVQHNLEPTIVTTCPENDLTFTFYLLSVDPSQWKYARIQRYSNSYAESFQETFLFNYCSELGPKSTLTIEPKALSHGYYLAVYIVSISSNMADFRQFIQPIEIIRSDLQTTFGGNETISTDGQSIQLNIYTSTIDPDSKEGDRRKLNFTLLCYPQRTQSSIFPSNTPRLGSSRPTEGNPQNLNPWSIPWSNLSYVIRRPELNIQFYESQCFSSIAKRRKEHELVQFDATTKAFTVSESDLNFDDGSLQFLLIVRHVTDGRQVIARLIVDKQTEFAFGSMDLNALDEVLNGLDNLALTNPKKAVQLVSGLADKLNEMSDTSVGLAENAFALSIHR